MEALRGPSLLGPGLKPVGEVPKQPDQVGRSLSQRLKTQRRPGPIGRGQYSRLMPTMSKIMLWESSSSFSKSLPHQNWIQTTISIYRNPYILITLHALPKKQIMIAFFSCIYQTFQICKIHFFAFAFWTSFWPLLFSSATGCRLCKLATPSSVFNSQTPTKTNYYWI